MHNIEPFYNWRHIYVSEEDQRSPFYGRQYSEFVYSQTVYNYYIHPQWDDFGSRTLYLKVLLADYEEKYAIIEMIGEWNDAVENDIMELKREVLEKLMYEGINKFILIAENVLNFHSDGKDYYEEWYDELTEENGPCGRPFIYMEQVPQMPSRQSWSNAMGSFPSRISSSFRTSNISRKDISEEKFFTW